MATPSVPVGEEESPDKGVESGESSYALMTRLTKFIYNVSDVLDIGR